MSDSQNIDDVLNSIRRLVSEEAAEQAGKATAKLTGSALPIDALLLGSKERVIEPEDPYRSVPPLPDSEEEALAADAAEPGDPPAEEVGVTPGDDSGDDSSASWATTATAPDLAALTETTEPMAPGIDPAAISTTPGDLPTDPMPIFSADEEEDLDEETRVLDFIDSLPDPVETVASGPDASGAASEAPDDFPNAPAPDEAPNEALNQAPDEAALADVLHSAARPEASESAASTGDGERVAPESDSTSASADDAPEDQAQPDAPEDPDLPQAASPFVVALRQETNEEDWAAIAEMDALGFDAPIERRFASDATSEDRPDPFPAESADRIPAFGSSFAEGNAAPDTDAPGMDAPETDDATLRPTIFDAAKIGGSAGAALPRREDGSQAQDLDAADEDSQAHGAAATQDESRLTDSAGEDRATEEWPEKDDAFEASAPAAEAVADTELPDGPAPDLETSSAITDSAAETQSDQADPSDAEGAPVSEAAFAQTDDPDPQIGIESATLPVEETSEAASASDADLPEAAPAEPQPEPEESVETPDLDAAAADLGQDDVPFDFGAPPAPEVPEEPAPEATAQDVETPLAQAEVLDPDEADPMIHIHDEEEDILSGGIVPGMGAPELDTEALRELVSEVVRQELAGALGERITRNVRKLVRRELKAMFSGDEFD